MGSAEEGEGGGSKVSGQMGYSIFTPYRGMEVKFQGVPQKEFLGGHKFLNMLFWGVKIFQQIFSRG